MSAQPVTTGRAGEGALAPFGSVRVVCVVTHHKTGTVWLKSVFIRIGKALGITFRFATRASQHPVAAYPADERLILVNGSGEAPPDLWQRGDFRVLHMIRDPRDVLISGMRFHRKAADPGKEPFLHRPSRRLGGRSYHEHLGGLPDDEARLLFEMENKHRITLGEMLAWDYGRDGVVEWRYEDLIADIEGAAFAAALRPFARDAEELERMRLLFQRNSLFGSRPRKDAVGQVHIASGLPRQWVTGLPLPVARRYCDLHGADLIALGYENDLDWLSQIEDAAVDGETTRH